MLYTIIMAAAGAPDGECGGGGGRPGRAGMKRALLGDVARHWGWAVTLLGHIGPAAPAQSLVPGPARGERPLSKPLAGMEEPGMDTEAETVATEAPARSLNCVEAEAAAGAAAEDSSAARGSLQPAPAQPPGDPAAQASVSNGEDAGGGAGRELVDLKIIWNKTKHDVKFPLDSTGSELKQKIHSITGNPRGADSLPRRTCPLGICCALGITLPVFLHQFSQCYQHPAEVSSNVPVIQMGKMRAKIRANRLSWVSGPALLLRPKFPTPVFNISNKIT